MQAPVYDVIVIGAGHAGLSASYFLAQKNVGHIVLEKGRVGETWRTQRWDSFAVNTPNALSVLPGDEYAGDRPEGFPLLNEFIGSLQAYAEKFHLPVKEQANVISVKKDGGTKRFTLTVTENGAINFYHCRQVIVASGIMNKKKVPSFSSEISKEILQLHTMDYKNPQQLPAGAVLVAGSAQSGCQIAEDLLDAGRRVYLSASMVARVPRRYRGKDIFDWFIRMKLLDMRPDQIPDPRMLTLTQPQVSGVGHLGHTVSLQSLARKGATILGKIRNAAGTKILFYPDAAENIKFADGFSQKIKEIIDTFILNEGIYAPRNEPDPADEPDRAASCASDITELDLKERGIHSIILTTGFTGDFSWIELPVLDEQGKPKHKNGISDVEGLYFIGFPWLRTRKSGIIYGIKEDAEFIVGKVLNKNYIPPCTDTI